METRNTLTQESEKTTPENAAQQNATQMQYNLVWAQLFGSQPAEAPVPMQTPIIYNPQPLPPTTQTSPQGIKRTVTPPPHGSDPDGLKKSNEMLAQFEANFASAVRSRGQSTENLRTAFLGESHRQSSLDDMRRHSTGSDSNPSRFSHGKS